MAHLFGGVLLYTNAHFFIEFLSSLTGFNGNAQINDVSYIKQIFCNKIYNF